MGSIIRADVPPYLMITGYPAAPHGINQEGLKRTGLSQDQLKVLRKAYKVIYKMGNRLQEALEQLDELAQERLQEALEQLDELAQEHEVVGRLPEFIRKSSRGIVR
jgi:UDP-N-acetylglucosamine acyltransferase